MIYHNYDNIIYTIVSPNTATVPVCQTPYYFNRVRIPDCR